MSATIESLKSILSNYFTVLKVGNLTKRENNSKFTFVVVPD